ncbi:MAG: Hsp20/alpha crystallin family protein [Candidatus Pacebacteria bacterium]|nr:Hsp20/alpha crystallin family protein [Candidatus Paceibacterota bacterium]
MFSKRKKNNENVKINPDFEEDSKWSHAEEGRLVVDVYETDHDLVIQSAIAGIKTEELDIALENDMMIIKGERRDPSALKNKKYFVKECYFGPFIREIILPREIDTSKIKAEIKEGILIIKMPKVERAKNKRINLDGNKQKNSEEKEELEDEEEYEEEIIKPVKKRATDSKIKKQKDPMIYEDEEDMEMSEKERNYKEEDEEE